MYTRKVGRVTTVVEEFTGQSHAPGGVRWSNTEPAGDGQHRATTVSHGTPLSNENPVLVIAGVNIHSTNQAPNPRGGIDEIS